MFYRNAHRQTPQQTSGEAADRESLRWVLAWTRWNITLCRLSCSYDWGPSLLWNRLQNLAQLQQIIQQRWDDEKGSRARFHASSTSSCQCQLEATLVTEGTSWFARAITLLWRNCDLVATSCQLLRCQLLILTQWNLLCWSLIKLTCDHNLSHYFCRIL